MAYTITEENIKEKCDLINFNSHYIFDFADRVELILKDDWEVKNEDGRTYVVRKQTNNVKNFCNMNDAGIYILGVLVGIFFGCATMFIVASFYPTAMDVYQGKTTLEYTIVDGVKVDSTVVWKNNK